MTDTADRVAMRFAEAIKGVVKDELRRRGLDWGYCDADVKIDIDKSLVEVTAAALSPSRPSGRSRSTMQRIPARASQTRTATSSQSTSPKSASPARGSRTTRERYAGSVYQAGGSPGTGQG